MSEVDFLVKLRDGATMIADAAQERLEKLGPRGIVTDQIPDLNQVVWKPSTGPKGAFDLAEAKTNENCAAFKDLVSYLAAHAGKATIQGFFVWKFTDSSGSVGRKVARQTQ
jgi:hypothetical protein